jgi:hypothetical protein
MKICSKCKVEKPFAEFPKGTVCRSCMNAYGRAWRANPETKVKRKAAKLLRIPQDRDGHLRRKYGIGLEQYSAMSTAQGGRCAICRTSSPGGMGSFHVDHDHATGKVRGLLCFTCNRGLGCFRDSEETLSLAIQYLERNK